MLKARHHKIVYPFFQYYTEYLLKRNFETINIYGSFVDKSMPVLLIANHIGWWDGFWAMYLKRKKIHRKFHFMMQEEHLLKYRFFNNTGAFSIKKNSRDIIESLSYASALLEQRDNMVLIYPQGKLRSLYSSEFHFEKGVGRIIEGKENRIQLIMSVNMVDYWDKPRPTLSVYIKEYEGEMSLAALENAYNSFYRACLSAQTSITK